MRLLIYLVIILWSGVAGAAPFLTCDLDINCQTYNVYADDVLLQADIPAPLNYDLVNMPIAGIEYDAECCNYRGCKKTINPFISLDDPTPPMNLNLKSSKLR